MFMINIVAKEIHIREIQKIRNIDHQDINIENPKGIEENKIALKKSINTLERKITNHKIRQRITRKQEKRVKTTVIVIQGVIKSNPCLKSKRSF